MAGVLLLINKHEKQKVDFDNIKNRLKNNTQKAFSEFYPAIHFREPNKNCFLVEFRKNNDNIKFTHSENNSWLSFEGTVFALNKTKAYNAKELLQLYFSDKQNFANQLDGHFVLKLYDANEDKYLIINDFIKNKTNFWCETEDYFMFTPFALTTAVIKNPVPDPEAINEFLWRYYILSERSILTGVRRLLPASEYKISNKKLSRHTYWDWPTNYTNVCFEDAVDRMVESMKESARLVSETFGKPCIDFTMGQDTRQVISAYTNQKINFTTSIFGKSDFYEVQRIREIAEQFGIEYHNIQLEKDYTDNLWQHFKSSVILSSCEEPGYLIGRLIYMRQQQSKLAQISLNGMDGHFYKNGLWDELYTFNLYREPKNFNVNSFLKLRALSKKYPDHIFNTHFLQIKRNSELYFREIINASIKNYLDSPVSIQVDRFDLYHWLNFTTVSNNSGNLVHNSISPLLLRRNLEFALQIPVKWKFNLSKFQRAVVYKLDPELAKLKTDFAGVNMVPKNVFTIIPFYFRYFYFQTERLRKKMLSKLGFNVVTHLQEAWDYLPLYQKLINITGFKENLKIKDMVLSSILDETEWEKYIAEFYTNDNQNFEKYEFLFKLVSVEYFLREAEKWN